MADEIKSGDHREFLDELSSITEGLSKGAEVRDAASGGNVKSGIDLKPGAVKSADADDEVEGFDPLRKNFESIAKSHRDFRHFGSTQAMDDPVSYLRETTVDMKGRRRYKVSNAELEYATQALLMKGATKEGTPLGTWMNRRGQSGAIQQAFEVGLSKNVFPFPNVVGKALDSTSGSGGPLIRTDIDPILREAYLRKFPLGDQVRRFPANGLVHTYDQRTSIGTASTITELGDLSGTDSVSTYQRKASSNIAVLATRRQISLKLQYAVSQSGMSFDLSGSENLEVIGALTAIARLNQSLVCQGNYSTSGKTVDDEDGNYDNTTFDGLRTILKGSGTSITMDTATETYMHVINRAVAQVINSGGDVDDLTILTSLGGKIAVEEELINFLRIMNSSPAGGIPTNLASNGILTVADTLSKLLPIPAAAQDQGVGYYTLSAADKEDMFVVDPNGIGLAYLGSPQPAVLELPIGFNNALSNVYIPFLMNGLVVFVTSFHRKIRIPKTTV